MQDIVISQGNTFDDSSRSTFFKLIRLKAVREKTGLATSTIYAMMKSGNFVRNVKLGKRSVGWYEHEVDEWIVSRRT
jgi:prophage regulatory protein